MSIDHQNNSNTSSAEKSAAKLLFLFPQASLNDGGHLAQEKFYQLAKRQYDAEFITYHQRDNHHRYLNELLKTPANSDKNIYCIHFGPHIAKLVKQLKHRRVIYFAHSTGWKFNLPKHMPIISVSKHSQAYWGRKAPNNPGYCLPNIISDHFSLPEESTPPTVSPESIKRKTDVIIVKRKMSAYLIDQLAPALAPHCNIKIIDYWVDDLAVELKQAKVFLYDSAEYWINKGVSEGFGLPPLEAAACGCTVFTSINDALSDNFAPGINCHQINTAGIDYDMHRVKAAVKNWQIETNYSDPAAAFRAAPIADAMQIIFTEINALFEQASTGNIKTTRFAQDAISEQLIAKPTRSKKLFANLLKLLSAKKSTAINKL